MDQKTEAPTPFRAEKTTSAWRKRVDEWRLRRRRMRQAKKRAPGRKMTIFLVLLVLALLSTFFASVDWLTPSSPGRELSLGELQALAKEKRIDTAVFLDEDNRLVGTYTEPPPEEEKEDASDERSDAKGKDADAKAGKNAGTEGDRKTGARDTDSGTTGAAGTDAQTGDSGAPTGGASGDREGDQGPASGPDAKNGDKGEPKKRGKGDAPADEAEEDPLAGLAPKGSGTFWFAYPKSGAAFDLLANIVTRSGAEVKVDSQSVKLFVRSITFYLLPLLILATVFGLLFATGKGSGGAIGEVISFGTMNKKRHKKGGTNATTFADVGSAEEAIAELTEVVDYLTNPQRYDEIGAVPPKGVPLFGPPGCGKTLLAKAVAGEAGVPFFSVAGAEFVESLVGVGAARVRDLFQRVRAVAPAIVFIDELDAAGRRRGVGGGEGGSDEREQTLNQLLVEMDGFEVSAGIVVIGATNRPDILDPALLRPGRFDRHITVEQPDHEGRVEILQLHARGKPIASSVDFNYLAKRTPGFSGADLASVVNEGALLSIREAKPEIETIELEEAIQRVLHGPKKRGRVLSDEEERRAAMHESGHAIIAAAIGRAETVHRVSILARGRGIGLTGLQKDSDEILLTTKQLYARLVVEMGGLAAEQTILDDISTGAEQDLEHATEMARDMIARYGMSPNLGRVRLMASDVDQFLGGQTGLSDLSVDTHRDVDREVKRLLEQAEKEALRILSDNRAILEKMGKVLEEHETLEGKDLAAILNSVPLEEISRFVPFPVPDEEAAVGNGQPKAARKVR